MSMFIPKIRIQRKARSFSTRCNDWAGLLVSTTKMFNLLGGYTQEDPQQAALVQARIENTKARTENARLQAEVTRLRAQKMGNEVTQAEQRAEKLELEIIKLRHELESRGILKSDNFQPPSY